MKGCVIFQLWPKSLQHHIITALKESDRTGGANDPDIQDSSTYTTAVSLWSHHGFHLNVEVFKCHCISPQQLHRILWNKREAKKALHLVRPWPLCHLQHQEAIHQILACSQHVILISLRWHCDTSSFCFDKIATVGVTVNPKLQKTSLYENQVNR